jgi:hypothetical protein
MSQLSPNSRFNMTLAVACVIAGALFGAGWRLANSYRDFAAELAALRGDVRACWTVRDMRDYITETEKLNRHLMRTDGMLGAVLPNAIEIHAKNQLLAEH